MKQYKKRIMALVLSVCMLFSIMPAIPAYAETAYDYQGLTGTVETDKGTKEWNNIKLTEPSDITVLETTAEQGGYFLNKINDPIDGTTGRIDFIFSMTSGMNNIGEPGNWNFMKNNLDPDPELCPGKATQVNVYALAEGETYTGEAWSKGKTPVINYDKGNLFIDDSKTFANITNSDNTGRIALYTTAELESGDYILEFGAETCGNNVKKILGVPVAFQFTVKGKYSFDEGLTTAKELRVEVSENTGTAVGQYRDADGAKLAELDAAIAAAESLSSESSAEERQAAADALNDAINEIQKIRIVDITFGDMAGVSGNVSVGASGTAATSVKSSPTGLSGYKKHIFSASDNIRINERTGEWTALWEGDGWIKATSTWHVNNPASVPDGKQIAEKKVNINVDADDGVLALGIPKGDTEEGKGMLQTIAEKASASGVAIDGAVNFKIYTARGASLKEADFKYIRDNFKGLKSIDISKATVDVLPSSAFAYMKSLESVQLPDRLKKISAQAFRGCTALKDVHISSGVTFIGDGAFMGCTALNGSMLTINAVTPPEVATYPDDVFEGINLSGIKVPYGCGGAYRSNGYWKKFTVNEDSVNDTLRVTVSKTGGLEEAARAALAQSIGSESKVDTLIIKTASGAVLDYGDDIPYLQNNFLNATTIDLSGAVLEDNRFKSSTFKDRVNLKKIRLHKSTENIAGNSFYGCKNLQDIILPAGLTKLGNGAFAGCDKLGSQIIIDAKTPPLYDGTVFPSCIRKVIVPAGSVAAYKKDEAWRQFEIAPQISINLDKSGVTLTPPGETTLTANVTTYGSSGKNVFWESSNSSVAKLSATTGNTVKVTALRAGTATITAGDSSGSVTAKCTITVKALPAPTVKAYSVGYNKNKVTWNGVSGADGYQVLRATSKSGTYYSKALLSSKSRYWYNTGLTTGKTYYYKVRAYKKDADGNKYYGDYSSYKYAKPTLSKPGTPTVSRSSKYYVKVKWKGVSGESGYQVYRARSLKGTYSRVKSVKMTTYSYPYAKIKTTRKKKYYYKVRAYKYLGNGKYSYGPFSYVKSYTLK